METTDPRFYNTSQTLPSPDPEGRGMIVTGTLTIFFLDESFSGIVECVASIELPNGMDTNIESVPQVGERASLFIAGKLLKLSSILQLSC